MKPPDEFQQMQREILLQSVRKATAEAEKAEVELEGARVMLDYQKLITRRAKEGDL